MDARRRPGLHFTPRQGWINDPHGIVWADGCYHLFFQHNPVGTSWGAAVNWGHATSADLVTWDEQRVALAPEPGELGCWSGSVVLSDHGVPTLFYTRVLADAPALGQVARALGDPTLSDRRREPSESVVVTLPTDVVEFRDPFVWRASDCWRMVAGARLRGGVGAALQYSSADLWEWEYDGIVTQRASSETTGAWTGSMWECPQLFPLDGTWVLLLSVLHDTVLKNVVYATTTFLDRDGHRCAMSWLREDRRGAEGLAMVRCPQRPVGAAGRGRPATGRPAPEPARLPRRRSAVAGERRRRSADDDRGRGHRGDDVRRGQRHHDDPPPGLTPRESGMIVGVKANRRGDSMARAKK